MSHDADDSLASDGLATETGWRREVLGLHLSSPVLIGSGLLTDQERNIRKLIAAGAGAVVTKTIHPKPPLGLDERIYKIDTGMLNSTTYSKRSVRDWLRMLASLAGDGLPVIASIHADTPHDIAELGARVAGESGFPLELGISCLHAEDGEDTPARVHRFTSAVRRSVSAPFAVKLGLSLDFVQKARAAVEAGASAITFSDTVSGVAVDPETDRPWLGGVYGYSGPGIKPLVLAGIVQLRQAGIAVPIMGSGGITTSRCVDDYIRVGADVVQVYTALHDQMMASLDRINAKYRTAKRSN